MQSILSPPTWRFWSRQLIICVWAQCKNIYLFICFVYSCQIRRSFEMFSGVTVLRSSPKFSIKTHCSQSWEEHRGMFNVRHLWTTHRRSATPNPKRVREWRASSFFSRVGKKYGNELWRRGGGASPEVPLCQDHNQMCQERPNRIECMSAIFSNLSDLRVQPQYHLIDI